MILKSLALISQYIKNKVLALLGPTPHIFLKNNTLPDKKHPGILRIYQFTYLVWWEPLISAQSPSLHERPEPCRGVQVEVSEWPHCGWIVSLGIWGSTAQRFLLRGIARRFCNPLSNFLASFHKGGRGSVIHVAEITQVPGINKHPNSPSGYFLRDFIL